MQVAWTVCKQVRCSFNHQLLRLYTGGQHVMVGRGLRGCREVRPPTNQMPSRAHPKCAFRIPFFCRKLSVRGGREELLRTLISATAGSGLLDDAFQHGNRTSSTPRPWQQSSQPARVCRQRTVACQPLVQMLMHAIDRPTRVLRMRACVRACIRSVVCTCVDRYKWAAFP